MSDGALYVEDSGAKDGEAVVFFHSSGMSGRQWRRLAQGLGASGYRTIVPDLSGHGKSPGWEEPRPFSYRVDVERMRALVASLPAAAHFVGHSYGGLIALLVALAEPAKVASIAVYDPVAFGTLDRVKDVDVLGGFDIVRGAWDGTPEGRERWLKGFVDYWGGAGAWESLREEARAEFRRVGWVVYRGVDTLIGDETAASAYRAFDAPALLMTGQHTPAAGTRVIERLGEVLPHARTEVFANAGHMGPLTHGDAVGARIARFVTERR